MYTLEDYAQMACMVFGICLFFGIPAYGAFNMVYSAGKRKGVKITEILYENHLEQLGRDFNLVEKRSRKIKR